MAKEEFKQGHFSPEAIAKRRKEDPPEVAAVWRRARQGPVRVSIEHWDGEKPKDPEPF